MSVTTLTPGTASAEPYGGMTYFRRLTVPEYHQMIRAGILDENDPVELLEGHLVLKMPRGPAHDFAIQVLNKRLLRLLAEGYELRNQSAATLPDSEPEPDFAIVRGDETAFLTRHPEPTEVAVLIEVSNSSVTRDTIDKARVYARAGIPVYWVVNIPDRRIEIFTDPDPSNSPPTYRIRHVYGSNDVVPLVLDGTTAGTIAVAEVIP